MKLLSELWSHVSGKAPGTTTDPPAPSAPRFLLPGSEQEYARRFSALMAEFAAEKARLLAEAAKLEAQADEIEAEGGSAAQRELAARQTTPLRAKAALLREEVGYAKTLSKYWGGGRSFMDGREKLSSRFTTYRILEIERAVRTEEGEVLAHQGEIAKQTFDDSLAKNVGSSLGKDAAHRRERRLVRYEGRVFLVHLTWHAVTRTEHHASGGRYGGPYETYLPTGDWKPPLVDWATDSLAQMTNAELEAIA